MIAGRGIGTRWSRTWRACIQRPLLVMKRSGRSGATQWCTLRAAVFIHFSFTCFNCGFLYLSMLYSCVHCLRPLLTPSPHSRRAWPGGHPPVHAHALRTTTGRRSAALRTSRHESRPSAHSSTFTQPAPARTYPGSHRTAPPAPPAAASLTLAASPQSATSAAQTAAGGPRRAPAGMAGRCRCDLTRTGAAARCAPPQAARCAAGTRWGRNTGPQQGAA